MGVDQLILLPERARPLEQLHGAIVAPTHCLLRGEPARTGGARIVTERLDTLPSADVELLALLAGGATVRDIGSRLGSSARTVQRRLAALRHSFGVATNREVVVAAGLR